MTPIAIAFVGVAARTHVSSDRSNPTVVLRQQLRRAMRENNFQWALHVESARLLSVATRMRPRTPAGRARMASAYAKAAHEAAITALGVPAPMARAAWSVAILAGLAARMGGYTGK